MKDVDGAPGQYAPAAAVAALLVRPDGSLLAQHRDDHAPIAPNQWGLVGGVQEDGEDPLVAVLRELREETGIIPRTPLTLFYRGRRPASSGPGTTHWHVYYGPCDIRDDDIDVNEGRDIRFVAPDRLLASDLGTSACFFVPAFLASPEYAACRGLTGRRSVRRHPPAR